MADLMDALLAGAKLIGAVVLVGGTIKVLGAVYDAIEDVAGCEYESMGEPFGDVPHLPPRD